MLASPHFLLSLAAVAHGPGSSVPLSKRVHLAPTKSAVADRLAGTNGSSIPANGDVWPTAIYWCMVEIGTPALSYPVAIDSGSGDLDVSGAGCVGCVTKAPNRAYDHTASSTARPALPFAFSNTYQTCDLKNPVAPCTITGKLFKDAVSLAGYGPVDVVLGSIEKQTSNFDQFKDIDGVMGFTMPSDKNVFSTLVKAGKIPNVWAMCMFEGSTSNGTLTVGGVDPRLSANVSYVPDVGRGFHSVEVVAITFKPARESTTSAADDVVVTHPDVPVGGAAILDTGTNVLLVGTKYLAPLQAAMCADSSLAHCTDLWSGTCVALTEAEVAAYPGVTLELTTGLGLDMSSKDYLLQGSPLAASPDLYCIGIKDGGSAGGTGFIIGDTTMRNYYLVFDLAQKRIGWGPVNKKTCGSI